MKFFKKPLVAILLSVLIVLVSTCVSARNDLIREHAQVCEDLGKSILSFAAVRKLPELESSAKALLSDPDSAEKKDYDALIVSYSAASSGAESSETWAVDHAVKDYRRFCQMTNRFPAKIFVELFHLF